MTVAPTTAYARVVESTGSVRQAFYKIAFSPDHLYRQHAGGEWVGPYRDKTDAENAAHDAARRQGLELQWID